MNSKTKEWLLQYPNFRQCSIQTFNDQRKDEKSQSRILPMTDENLEKCEKLQQILPYGIYFSVNPMESWKRDKSSVKFIQTRITDIDEWDKSLQLELINNAPLKPTFVVESVHWFHLYYLAEEHLTQEQFEEWNLGLREYYHWDVKVCKDIARVLRIPWYYHMKGEPVMVERRKDLSSWALYSVEEITKAFPKKEEKAIKAEYKPVEKKWDCSDSYREKVNRLDNKEMLYELSWTRWVNGEIIDFKRNSDWTEQITINWVPKSCRIDKDWMIGSYDWGWPSWVQRIEWYLKRKLTKSEWNEISKIVNAKYPELDEKKQYKKIDLNQLKNRVKTKKWLESPDFSWGEAWLDNAIWKIARWQLVVLSWETWAGKTTFATFMARKNPNSYYFVLEDTMDNIARRYALRRAWITKDELNNHSRWAYKEDSYNRAYDMFLEQDINYLDIWEKISVDELINAMKQLKEEWYWMFFIDNLGFIIWEWNTETEQTADISHKLVSFCIKENVCVVLLHHFKKWDWTNKPRDISQLRGSGKLWDDSFIVANYMRQWDETVLRVLKDRNLWELKDYVMTFDRGDFIFQKEEWR